MSGYIIIHCICICTCLNPSVWFLFVWLDGCILCCHLLFVCLILFSVVVLLGGGGGGIFVNICISVQIIMSHCICICMSLDPCFCLFLSECLYQSPAILSLVVFVYMYVSSSMSPLSLSLWMLVLVSGYIIIYCMPTCTALDPPWYNCTGWLGVKHQFTYVSWSVFLSFPLKVYIGARLYYNPLYVYMYVSWSVFLSVFFLTVCISVLLYYHLLYVYMYVVSGPRGAVSPSGREETLLWVALSTPRELPWVTWPWWPCHEIPCHGDLALGDLATETLPWRFSHGDFSMETMPPWRRCHGRSRHGWPCHGDLAMGDLAMEILPPWRPCLGDLAMGDHRTSLLTETRIVQKVEEIKVHTCN